MSGRWRWQWVLFGAAVGTLYVVERLRPLRSRKEPGPARVGRNLAIGLLAGATTAASEWPVVAPVQRLAERNRLGLLRWLPLPRPLRAILGFLLLDYTLYVWHRWNHRAPFLWKFHAVHHLDLDLDSTTGLRFHFGELTLAAWFRAAQILLIGVDRATLRAWQQLLVLSVVFHHSNLQLPIAIERRLVKIIVTPRMHGIHHSTRGEEVDANYSSLLSAWDRLHRSLKLNVPQKSITIGVEGFLDATDVTLAESLTLPFRDDARLRLPGEAPAEIEREG
ncbi:MAG TPA: sterol desaturase family protein [Vicinamibacterales bacterium]|jgi:sterol desaturase/sphingolipid hydroxylase (fatty acid hydroxylase superfamily)|nr:sterol desaturase family protein [Vicinamibacterales bacterium]